MAISSIIQSSYCYTDIHFEEDAVAKFNKSKLVTTEIQFKSVDSFCRGTLYKSSDSNKPPIIIMGHGLGSIREMRLPAFAERFVEAGYACLTFDYRHFGNSDGEPRQLLDIKKQLQDWNSSLAYVRSRDDVDHQKIIIWGTSFGGGHVLTTAAKDHRIAAVISQCPFTDGLASGLAMSPITSVQVTALAITDRIGSWLGAKPIMIKSAGEPHSAALMTAEDCKQGYLQLVPPHSTFRNYVAARFALDILTYYPGKLIPKIQCPILFCICETDSVAPAKPTLKYAKEAANKEIKIYKEGHFDIYVNDGFEKVIHDQINFLNRVIRD